MLASHFFRHLIRVGTLTVVDAYGKTHRFAGAPGRSATVRLHDPALHRRLPLNPYLAAGEAYMDGTPHGRGRHHLRRPRARLPQRRRPRQLSLHAAADRCLKSLLNVIHTYNPIGRAQRNVAHHYDLSGELYDLFLDSDRQYSCAYFATDNDSLEVAQDNKKRHIAAKLLLRAGPEGARHRLRLGRPRRSISRALAGVDVTGVTLSIEQQKVARDARAAPRGLGDRVRFHLRDYREETGTFDRIVSVGMFEHVGVGHYREFFAKVRDAA